MLASVLRVVLYAYPASFRREFGTEWVRSVADLHTHGGLSAPRLAGRVVIDALGTAPRMRWEALVGPAKLLLSFSAATVAVAAIVVGSPAIPVLAIALVAMVAIHATRHDRPIAP